MQYDHQNVAKKLSQFIQVSFYRSQHDCQNITNTLGSKMSYLTAKSITADKQNLKWK